MFDGLGDFAAPQRDCATPTRGYGDILFATLFPGDRATDHARTRLELPQFLAGLGDVKAAVGTARLVAAWAPLADAYRESGEIIFEVIPRAGEDSSEGTREASIKKNQLVGIEYQDDIYALAASNMILHGDGKSNIFQGDCFKMVDEVKKRFKPTAALLNPPYKSHKDDPEELAFALNALEMLEKGGKCVIILPMSCALAQKGDEAELKRKLIEKHTLEAVLSLPNELFHNSKVGVVTSIMVFTAHRPHPVDKKTWFGYWKNDGFVKSKNLGRTDLHHKWDEIKKAWLSAYHNRDDIPGQSVKRVVSHTDEWCAEAYMETDYATLKQEDFEREVKKFTLFNMMLDTQGGIVVDSEEVSDAT